MACVVYIIASLSFDAPAARAASVIPPPDKTSIKAGVMRWRSAYKEGMAGVHVAVESCFRRLGRTPTYSALDYCFAMEIAAHDIDSGLAKKIGFPPDDYFSMEAVLSRAEAKLKAMPGSEMEKDRHLAGVKDAAEEALAELVLPYGS